MPFAKGNTLWAKGLAVKKEMNEKKEELMITIVNGGLEDYIDKLVMLRDKQDLTKEEREFMDRFERLIPYGYGKKSNVDHTSLGERIYPKPILDGLKKEDAQD